MNENMLSDGEAFVVGFKKLKLGTTLVRNIIICLVLGNSIDISSVILLAKKIQLIEVPKEINNQQIIVVSFLAGIGFTILRFNTDNKTVACNI